MKVKMWLSVILLTICLSVNARTYLVSVGITDYSKFPYKIGNLHLTTRDAETVVDIYSRNRSVDYALLLNDKASKSRILGAMKKVYNMAGENDIVVFFFSGHGYSGGFCAYDGKLSYDEVRKAMSKSLCRNKIMFVDACRSGGMRVDDNSSRRAVSDAKNANVMLFMSSRNNENSIERQGMENGFFTTYLHKGLKGNADVNGDRKITAKELFEFVNNGVNQLSGGKQHPVMWGNFNDNLIIMEW